MLQHHRKHKQVVFRARAPEFESALPNRGDTADARIALIGADRALHGQGGRTRQGPTSE